MLRRYTMVVAGWTGVVFAGLTAAVAGRAVLVVELGARPRRRRARREVSYGLTPHPTVH